MLQRVRPSPAVLLVVSVALAGTGATGALLRVGEAGIPLSDTRAAAVRALSRPPGGGTDSGRYLIRYALEAPGHRREVGTFEGRADFRRQRFLAKGRGVPEGPDNPRQFDVFVFGRWQYERSPEEPRWSRRFLQPQNFGTPTRSWSSSAGGATSCGERPTATTPSSATDRRRPGR